MPLLPYEGSVPEVADDAWVAPGAVLVGRVRLGSGSSVWYGAVLRGDGDAITVGAGSNVQDGTVVHADPGFPAVIGAGSLVAAGAVVLEGTVVPPRSLVAGVPAKVRRELTDEEFDGVKRNAAHYRELAQAHREVHAGR